MNQTFIQDVCSRILQDNPAGLHGITVVVPAKRSLRFFSNAFVAAFAAQKKAAVLPKIITLSDLMDELSPYAKLTPLETLFHFYEVYTTLEKEPDTFDKFFTWAPSLLADFNEVDNYMIDVKQLYTDLKNIKEIEEWSFGAGELSAGQEKLNAFWVKLPAYYEALNTYLHNHKLAYGGMFNKHIAQHASQLFQKQENTGGTYVFAGFNALTKCEYVLLNHLLAQNKTKVYFDLDNYYFDNPTHEAGLFLRNHVQNLGKAFDAINANQLATGHKEINFYECNGETLQCTHAIELLQTMPNTALEKTAIVLCNEQLLPVLIHALPSTLDKVNVTMGWPLKYTQANDFFVAFMDVCIAFGRNKKYIKPTVLHQFLQAMSNFVGIEIQPFATQPNVDQFLDMVNNTYLKKLFSNIHKPVMDVVHGLVDFLNDEIMRTTKQGLHLEICTHYSEVFQKLLALPNIHTHMHSWYVFKQLFSKYTRNYPLAFVGEPFAGVQVMGMLETRGLDFENVIVLSANEGYLPAQTVYTGYIPYDLRAYVKLPGKAEQDAVFAYYFYRLLQRAKTMHVYYNAQNELLRQEEKSRYLLQVEKELSEKNTNISVKKHVVDALLEKLPVSLQIQKTPFYHQQISALFARGISATSINTYIQCPLDFYFKNVLGFKELKPEGVVDESVIGNIVHEYFNALFSAVQGKKIQKTLFTEKLMCLEHDIHEITHEKFGMYDFTSGENFLALEMVKKMATNFLQQQLNGDEFYCLAGKTVVGSEIPLHVNFTSAKQEACVLKGNIDLLLTDESNVFYVYDFKTGRVNETSLSLTNRTVLQLNAFATRDKLLQLVLYKKLVAGNYATQQIETYIIPLATGATQFLKPETEISDEEILHVCLNEFIDALRNTTEPIQHNEKNKFCEFCS